jgi:peptidase E
VTFVATASGDAPSYVADFYRAFGARGCHVSDIGLFDRGSPICARTVLAQDVVYVGGGNTASLLASGARTASTARSSRPGTRAWCSPASAPG